MGKYVRYSGVIKALPKGQSLDKSPVFHHNEKSF